MAISRKNPQIPQVVHENPWTDFINPEIDEVDKIVEKYGFHPLDRDAILEENQYARIDTYDEYMFMVLHFPKYDTNNERYVSNEFNIFIAPTYLLTFRYYQTGTVKKLEEKYNEWEKTTPYPSTGFLLYEIIENLLEHVMKMLERFHKDLKMIEKTLFTANGPDLIREIMVKKRNIITLKHMISPQIGVMKLMRIRMANMFGEEIETYFENLEDKLDKIHSETLIIQENIDSMEDTLKSIFGLKTNSTIKYLTVFSAFMLPLTLVTSFFGMNTETGHFNNLIIFFSILALTIMMVILTYFFLKKMIFSPRSRGILSLIITTLFLVILIPQTLASSGDERSISEEFLEPEKNIFMLPFTRIMGKFFMSEELRNDGEIFRFVSKEFSLTEKSYAPSDLELMTGGSLDTAGRVIYLRKEALDALTLLARDFEKEMKRPLVVVSGYRSANYQQRLWDLGRCTDTLCAPPGYSEHQLGLAIDIFEATTEKDYLANRAFARYLNWFQENAHKYGFHQSYQKGEKIDAYEVEPWHWRYIGIPLATQLKTLNMTYTEYTEFMSMRKFWNRY